MGLSHSCWGFQGWAIENIVVPRSYSMGVIVIVLSWAVSFWVTVTIIMFIELLLYARLDVYSLLLSSLSYDPLDSLPVRSERAMVMTVVIWTWSHWCSFIISDSPSSLCVITSIWINRLRKCRIGPNSFKNGSPMKVSTQLSLNVFFLACLASFFDKIFFKLS